MRRWWRRHTHEFNTFVGSWKDTAVGFVAFIWRCECGATTAETFDLPTDA